MTDQSHTAGPGTLGAILCGGEGQRFGGNKPFAVLGGEALLSRCIARARPQVAALVLAAGPDPGPYTRFGCDTVTDPVGGEGPLAGVIAALNFAATGGFQNAVTFAGDTPFFPQDLVLRLADADRKREADCIIAMQGGAHHRIFALWRTTALPRLQEAFARGMRKMSQIEEVITCVTADFPPSTDAPGGDSFFNINTPADFATAEAYLKSASAFPKV